MQHLGAQPGLWQVPLTFWNNAFMLLSSVSLPRQESTLSSFYVKHTGECWGWEGGQEGLGRVARLVTPCIPCRAVRQVEGCSSEGETPWTDGWLAFLGTTRPWASPSFLALTVGSQEAPRGRGCPQARFPEVRGSLPGPLGC